MISNKSPKRDAPEGSSAIYSPADTFGDSAPAGRTADLDEKLGTKARRVSGHWTEAEKERIADLLQKGLSASQIADHWHGVTRNSVIGVVNRDKRLKAIGFLRDSKGGWQVGIKKPRKAKFVRQQEKAAFQFVRHNSQSPTEYREPKMLNLIDLSSHTCRWPIGDPKEDGFGFCGHSVDVETPYCQYHRMIGTRETWTC